MVNPVLSRIDCEWTFFDCAFVDLVTETKQDAEARPGKSGMGRMKEDVIARKMYCRVGEARGHQEFFDGEVRKLYDRRIIDIDDGNQTGTSRKHSLMGILGAPVVMTFRILSGIHLNGEYFHKLFNTKRANGGCETL